MVEDNKTHLIPVKNVSLPNFCFLAFLTELFYKAVTALGIN